jgi:two-component system cell cycle response regulator DivK
MPYVLVVEDNTDARDALCHLLERRGHRARGVPGGRVAMNSVLEHAPDLIILDLSMPDMDGESFLQVLRSYIRLQSLPVVVWTAFPESPMVSRVRRLGIRNLVLKGSTSYEDLLAEVDRQLPRANAAEHQERPEFRL